jgi:hypothetical protein
MSLMFRIAALLIATTLLLFLIMTKTSQAIELPNYRVVLEAGDLELRDYAPSIVAETPMPGDFDQESDQSFRRLAGFIFGDNRSRSAEPTAPQEAKPSEKIAMTSPVTTVPSGDGWVMRFMMPSSYTMETLPVPNDDRVVLREDPGGLYAAVRFSGRWTEASFQKNLEELRGWMGERGLEAAAEPVIARYDPPWTPPFMRRNEILIAVRGAAAGEAQPSLSRPAP